ncbi:MAG: hypothetical protein D4R73_08990 [Deltaproteobacteria bacterium]|nr:MAG: hypothetical protein D4R73_08990 [Deltaproteobacteria bacterium]
MHSNQNILIICREQSDAYLLARLKPRPGCRYIEASGDVRVDREAGRLPWVSEVCWLEQMESFYQVAQEVIKCLEVINRWTASLGDDEAGVPKELLFWIRHSEGGMTTQRLQDMLLLIRSYLHLMDSYKANQIIILRNPGSKWEDDVLAATASSLGITSKVVGRFRLNVFKGWLFTFLKNLPRDPYHNVKFLKVKLLSLFQGGNRWISNNEIDVQLCSSALKHVENIIPIMKSLRERGFEPIALTWRAEAGAKTIRREGLRAEDLDSWVPFSALWQVPFRVYRTWRQANKRYRELSASPELRFRNVSLGPLLFPSMKSFFLAELGQRYRFLLANGRYFAIHSPLAVKLWGGDTLAEGIVALKILREKPRRPLFIYWFWVFIENPYELDSKNIDLFLAAGKAHEDYLKKLGVSSDRMASVGLSRYDHLPSFQQEYSPAQSRAFLKVPEGFQSYILFDPNAVIRGYLTGREQSQQTNTLLEFAAKHPRVALIIKPHPSHQPGSLEALLDFYSLPNVFFLNENMLPYHAINAADLVLTKFSTIALEAMLFEKPVISVILDGEDHFKIYGEAVEYVTNIEELNGSLNNFYNDRLARTEWARNQIEKQKIFLRDYLGENGWSSSELGAEVIANHLQRMENSHSKDQPAPETQVHLEWINRDEIELNEMSVVNDIGTLFLWRNVLYRAISPEGAHLVRDIFECGMMRELVENGIFPDSHITGYRMEGHSLVVEHKKIEVLSYPYEWPFSMLKAAALTVLKLNLIARKYGYQTKDCHPFNVVFDGLQPQFVDLGSFVKVENGYRGWGAYEEFMKSYYYPLKIWARGNPFLARSIIANENEFLPHHEYLSISNKFFLNWINFRLFQNILDKYFRYKRLSTGSMMQRTGLLQSLVAYLNGKNALPFQAVNLQSLMKTIEGIAPKRNRSSWDGYQQEFFNRRGEIISNPRFGRICELVHSYSIKSVVELGGNQGALCLLLIQKGHLDQVICTDKDEDAVDQMYLCAKGKKIPFSPVLLNCVFPVTVFHTRPPHERFRADLVIALALTHHLLLTNGLKIEFILGAMAKYTRNYAMIEFMPLGLWDGHSQKPRPHWYTRDWFREAFQQFFKIILEEKLEENRILFFGELREPVDAPLHQGEDKHPWNLRTTQAPED